MAKQKKQTKLQRARRMLWTPSDVTVEKGKKMTKKEEAAL